MDEAKLNQLRKEVEKVENEAIQSVDLDLTSTEASTSSRSLSEGIIL